MSQSIQPADPVVTLCNSVIFRHADKWPPSEAELADAFVDSFSLELVTLEESLKLCQTLGIEVSFAVLPPGLHGMNGKHGNRRAILVSTDQALAFGKLHTLLHEIRELLEYTFSDLGYPTVEDEELDDHAEEFACLARMSGGKKVFGSLIQHAAKVEVNWKRWLAFGGIGIFFVAHLLYCGLHSQLEDAVVRARRKNAR